MVTALNNLQSDVANPDLPDRDRYLADLAELEQLNDDLLALGGVLISSDQADNPALTNALDDVDRRLAALDDAESADGRAAG